MASAALEKARERISRIRAHAREKEKDVMATAVFPIAGGALGYIDSAYGDNLFFGLSNALVLGVAGTGASLFGLVGGETADRLLNVGQAGLAIYGYKFGFELAAERHAQQAAGGNENAAENIRRP